MIELHNVTKYYLTDLGRHYVLRDVSLKIPHDINVAIIGANGAGKSTMLRLLAGVDTPNSGKIVRTGRISWPMGLTPGVQPALNGVENARFACRIYGLSSDEIRQTIEKVREISDIGKHFELPVNTYSSGMRQRLSFAISMSLDFDYYLFDEIGAGGDRAFKKLANELIEKRLSSANFIMVSHNPGDVIELCQAAILLRDATVTYFDDVRKALEEYGESDFVEKRGKRRARKQSGGKDEPEAPAAAGEAGAKREKRLASEQKKALNSAARAEKREHRLKLQESKKKARAAKSSRRRAPAGAAVPDAVVPSPSRLQKRENTKALRREKRQRKHARSLAGTPEQLSPVALPASAGPAAVAGHPLNTQEQKSQRQQARRQKRLQRELAADLAGQPSIAATPHAAIATTGERQLARRQKKRHGERRRATGRARHQKPRSAGVDENGLPLAKSATAYNGVEELAERWAARQKDSATTPISQPARSNDHREPEPPAPAGASPQSAGK